METRKAGPEPTRIADLVPTKTAGAAPTKTAGPVGVLPAEAVARPAVKSGPAAGPGPASPPAPPVEPPTAPDTASLPPGAARIRPAALVIGVVVALAIAVVAALILLVPGRDGGTRTIETPATQQQPPREPTPDARDEAPQRPAPDRDPVTDLAAPTSQVPRPPEARRTRQPGAIADCEGKLLSEPATLLLACGDGGALLSDLIWTNWGEPTASARGRLSQRICEPNCANGSEAHSPATVTVSGPVGGRYTLMRIRAPQSPFGPLDLYTLDERGPTLRL
ncbi:hypothetical protein [Streptomyces sp. NPDC007346]|uniref:hypothetical protein n=1 Tax=Streptomyces sp. NPDC007346 TaxID=3154682 RepID=UPI003451FAEB